VRVGVGTTLARIALRDLRAERLVSIGPNRRVA